MIQRRQKCGWEEERHDAVKKKKELAEEKLM
jgi:hypothetical protein